MDYILQWRNDLSAKRVPSTTVIFTTTAATSATTDREEKMVPEIGVQEENG